MTTATNLNLGDIRLAGDLAGSNDGLNPQLTPTGVTAGSYTLPQLTIDAKGRITSVSPANISDILPVASTTQKGIAQIGSGIDVNAGLISIPNATTSTFGKVKIGTSSGLSISEGVLDFDTSSLPYATNSTLGAVKIGAGITVASGVISTTTSPNATTSTKGIVQVGSNLAVNSGVLSVPWATNSTTGVVRAGYGLKVVTTGGYPSLEIDTAMYATSTTAGYVKLGSNLVSNAGVISAVYGIASTTQLGLIKVGTGLSIDGAGSLSLNAPDATTTSKGIVQIGTGLSVTNGVVSVPDATTSSKGIVQIGTGLSVSGDLLNAKLASNTEFGVVKPASTSDLTISDGELSVGPNIPKLNTNNTFTKAQTVALVDLGDKTGTVSLDLSAGNVQKMVLTGNITLANISANANLIGGIFHIILSQDSTGGRVITFGSNFKALSGLGLSYDSRASRTTILTFVIASGSVFLSQTIEGFLGV